jgi:hypothetical protein
MHEIIWVELARLEGGPGPGLKFWPFGSPAQPAQMDRLGPIQPNEAQVI